MSQDQNKEFDTESKEAIRLVFQKFDKDSSGEIDYSEIKLIAQELGISLEGNDIQQIFADLDINKDKKISFEEFWEWWKLGRPNKLEKMVYYKLKSLKLLKRAHSDFVRIGGSLDVKYNDNIDSLYAALNYGSHPGDFRVQVKVLLNNKEGEQLITETYEGITRNENEQDRTEIVAFIIRIQSQQPEKAATNIKFLIDSLRNMLLQLAEGQQSHQLVNLINLIKISVSSYKNEVVIKFSFPPDIYKGFVGDDPIVSQMTDYYTQSFLQTNLNLSITAGIKNSLEKISENFDCKFVDWILEGFLFELKLTCNRSFIEQISKSAILMQQHYLEILQQKLDNNQITQDIYDQSVSKLSQTVLLFMIRSAKLHLAFKDIDDVNGFFIGMGLEDLAKAQPTIRELLEEIKEDFPILKVMKDENSLWNILYKFLNCFQENCDGQTSFSLIYKKAIVQVVLTAKGIGEIFNFLMK